MASLAEIRARLQEQDTKTGKSGGGDSAIYPFWNIPEGTTATIRFLPDNDPANTFFWLERQMIRLPFPGIKGGDEGRAIAVQVPCVEMWGDSCPVLAEVRPWFKDKSLEDLGRRYWKKRSYIFQGFVVNNPLNEESVPENPIRRFIINTSIFNIIKTALMDPEMENIPTDFTNGTDFRLVKTTKGQYADYSTSNWARKERSLNEQELEAVQKHGLFNLNDFMPKKPNQDELGLIKEMFEASVNGELFNQDRWGAFYRTGGGGNSPARSVVSDVDDEPVVARSTAPAARPAPAPAAAAPAEAPKEEGKKANVDDILKMIRERKTQA
jgi:hypothetical protein